MSTPISTQAETAREQSRDPRGKFGTQPAAEATTNLGSLHGNKTCHECGAPATSGKCRACLTLDAREDLAAGTTPELRLQMTGPVGDMDPQIGYLSMVAHVAEVDPGGVRERYGLDENASYDDVITAAEDDFADANNDLVYGDQWAQVSDDNPYAPVSEYGPVTEPGGARLGDASIGDEVVTSRTYATGDPGAPYLTVTSTHGVFAQITGGPDFATKNPLDHSDWEDERDARAHLDEQEHQLKTISRNRGLLGGDDLKDVEKDIAQRQRYVAELRELNPGKLTFYTASQMEFTTHTDHDDVGGSELHSDITHDEGDFYLAGLGTAERQAHGDCQRAFDHVATVNFDWPGKAS